MSGVLKFVHQRVCNAFNGETCWAFLKRLRWVSIRADRQVVVIVDNAKYHHARLRQPWREKHETEFRLLFLPPYSPELNPIERVWKLVRRLRLHNRYLPELDQVSASVEDLFADWRRGNQTLRRLCALI